MFGHNNKIITYLFIYRGGATFIYFQSLSIIITMIFPQTLEIFCEKG